MTKEEYYTALDRLNDEDNQLIRRRNEIEVERIKLGDEYLQDKPELKDKFFLKLHKII